MNRRVKQKGSPEGEPQDDRLRGGRQARDRLAKPQHHRAEGGKGHPCLLCPTAPRNDGGIALLYAEGMFGGDATERGAAAGVNAREV